MTMSEVQEVANELTKGEIRTLKFLQSMILSPIIVFFYLSLRFDIVMNPDEFGLMCLDWSQAVVRGITLSLMLLPFGVALVSWILNKYVSRKHGINDIRLSMEMSRPLTVLRNNLLGFLTIIALEVVHQMFCVIDKLS